MRRGSDRLAAAPRTAFGALGGSARHRRVTRAGETVTLGPNGIVALPAETEQRLRNAGGEPLEVVEVQVGEYLGEDDIVRLADDYGRVARTTAGPVGK